MKKFKKMGKYLGMSAAIVAASFSASAAMAATVYVGHGIPGEDAEDALSLPQDTLDPSLPVDVLVNGNCLLTGFTLGEFAGPLTLDAGTYTVSVHPADSVTPCSTPAVIGPASIPVEADTNATIFAHLTEDGRLGASVFPNDVSATDNPGKGRLSVHHAAAAPTVDVAIKRKNKSRNTALVEDVSNGDFASAELNNRSWVVRLFPADSDQLVYESSVFHLNPTQTTNAYAVGSLANGTLEIITNTMRKRRN